MEAGSEAAKNLMIMSLHTPEISLSSKTNILTLVDVSCTPPSSPTILQAIDSLPSELLVEVFVHCTHNDPLAPLSLSCISKQWRNIVYSSPSVWQYIDLEEGALSIEALQHQARLWIEQSKPLLFDIQLDVDSRDSILPLLSPFLPALGRWRNLTLAGPISSACSFSMRQQFAHIRNLGHLVILINDEEDETLDSSPSQGSGGVSYVQNLEFLPCSASCAHQLSMNLSLATLPHPDLITPLRFTCISISDCSLGFHLQPLPILRFLSACQELEQFYYIGFTSDDEPITEPIPVVVLSRLHMLQLRTTCSARALLSHIHAPNLQELYLAHLNVEFNFTTQFLEDGDSDDESGDYSQSPSSDHATGMGLRKLISRSHPPLQVLDMDFSDMRTKDFLYVFDRLDVLEEFSIVASDMSDKVIKFLKPYGCDGDEALSRRVRMPNLRVLELYDCNQVPGTAIVEALTTRVDFTDESTPERTLTRVVVSGCEHVTSRDRDMLMKRLGDRYYSQTS